MRIAILRNPSSIHIHKWIDALSRNDLYIFHIRRDNKVIDYNEKYEILDRVTFVPIDEMLSNNNVLRALRYILRKLGFEKYIHKNLARQLDKKLLAHDIQILHVHGVQFYGQIASYIEFKPYIVSLYGSDILKRKKDKQTELEYIECFKKAEVVESSSKYVANIAKDNFSLADNKLRVFPWGVNLDIFNYNSVIDKFDKIEFRNKFYDASFIVLSQRSMTDLYNWKNILFSVKLIAENNQSIHIIMIKGFGLLDNCEFAKQYIEEHDLSRYITIYDHFIPIEDLLKIYAGSDAFISIPNSDNIADSLIEGIAMKCYPILSKNPAYFDIFSNNNASFIESNKPVHIYNEIINAKERINRSDIVESNFQQSINQFSWKNVAIIQEKIYNEILNKK